MGGAGLGAPDLTLEPGSPGSETLAAASNLISLPNPPQIKSAWRTSGDLKEEGHKETPTRARLSPLVMAGVGEAQRALLPPSSSIL